MAVKEGNSDSGTKNLHCRNGFQEVFHETSALKMFCKIQENTCNAGFQYKNLYIYIYMCVCVCVCIIYIYIYIYIYICI